MQRMPELDDALQDLSEVVSRRLVIVDESMRVVGYSIHESDVDRQRLSHVLAHSDSWAPPPTSGTAYRVAAVPVLGDCVFVRLADRRHQIVGHLVLVLGEDPLPAQPRLDALLQAAPSLGAMLSLRRRHADRDRARARALTVDLVTGDSQQRSDAAELLVEERLLSSSGVYCAVALGVDQRTGSSADSEKTALAVDLTLSFVHKTSTASVVGSRLESELGALVFPRPVVIPRLTRILERPEVTGVRAGIGPLVDIARVHESFDRARLAWRASCLAPGDHPIVVGWDEAGLDGTLARLPVEEFTIDDLPAAARRVLLAGLGADIIATLDCYLNEGCDAQRTARVLNIHRSTLYYRLDKMRETIGGDLRDGRLRRELHTGLRIAQLGGLGPGGT